MKSPERKVVNGSESVPNRQPELQADLGESRAKFTEGKPTTSTLFLLALAALAFYFCYLIARPFLTPIFLAVMIAIVFHPIHVRAQAGIRDRNAAALISTILVLIVLVVPTIGLGVVVSREVRGLYQLLDERSAQQGGGIRMRCISSTGYSAGWVNISTSTRLICGERYCVGWNKSADSCFRGSADSQQRHLLLRRSCHRILYAVLSLS